MFFGAHFLIYSKDADADRAFLRDVLQFRSVEVGHGWLIFALPPAEVAVHPSEGEAQLHSEPGMAEVSFYLMCDDLDQTLAALEEKGVKHQAVDHAPWGAKTAIDLPSGARLGLYQPRHALALTRA